MSSATATEDPSDTQLTKTATATDEQQQDQPPATDPSAQRAEAEALAQAKAKSALRWGYTPKGEYNPESDPAKMPADHPVHRVSAEQIEKWQRKGINPVLRAEMDNRGNKEGRFWSKVAGTAMGGGWIR